MDEQATTPIDDLFRKTGKKGRVKIVDSPHLLTPIGDSHAHLQMLESPALALARAGAHQVEFVECIVDVAEGEAGTYDQLPAWIKDAQLLVRQMGSLCCGQAPYNVPKVRVAAGVHPHNAKDWTPEVRQQLITCLKHPMTSALGEIGLDYHYDASPREQQQEVFAEQLQIAQEAGLPVALHVREAFDDAFAILQEANWDPAGVLLHCYTSDAQEIGRWVDAGCYIAFGGALTFGRSDDIREAIHQVPANRLLLETDAPFMTPHPLRGEECEPAHTVFTACRALDEILGADASQKERIALLEQTYANTLELLDRAPTPWQEACKEAFKERADA
ncbi:MAG: TatD family hydrolase [Eggerthellaceae bacterium]|nr:TatD family hydrolase [Eggerthellaceae bacterium]